MTTTITLTGATTKREAAWIRALNRAEIEGTDGKFLARHSDDAWTGGACTGANGEVYRIDETRCECLAGRNNAPCKHVAALFARYGLMERLVPDFYRRISVSTPDAPIAA